MGLSGSIPVGVQVDPSSIIGDNLVWKNAQKNDTKNRISETMNRKNYSSSSTYSNSKDHSAFICKGLEFLN